MTSPFHDVEAEQDVVGACLVSRHAVEAVARTVLAADFASPNLAAAFAAVVALHAAGQPVDATTVTDELRRQGTDWPEARADLLGWATDCPVPSNAAAYGATVARFAAKRGLRGIGTELVDATADPTRDPGDIADEVRARLSQLDSPSLAADPGDIEVADLLSEDDALRAAPVIPRLLAEDDRAVIVAPEGVGKSELSRQLVSCTAYGLHPFTLDPIPAVPVLLVDLENPRELVRRRLGSLAETAHHTAKGGREPLILWHRPGGIDLRRRSDRVAFEDVLRRRRPKLVSLGPVYKSYTRTGRESDEQVAAEVQAILDDLRTRYAFALILEHHAPQANGGVRDLRPFGSSLWLRWPEYGLKLTPDRDRPGNLVVGRWRGDRSQADWPDQLHRGDVWPWVGWWQNSTRGEAW